MHNLTDKMCPMMGKTCLLNGSTFFNERLGGCEISILNYNLYQVKEHIRAWINQPVGGTDSAPASNAAGPNAARFPRPIR